MASNSIVISDSLLLAVASWDVDLSWPDLYFEGVPRIK